MPHQQYTLTPIHCRPWQLNAFSLKLIESHYENNYGGALRRLNAITEKLASLDFDNTPGYVINNLLGGHSGWRAFGGPVKQHV